MALGEKWLCYGKGCFSGSTRSSIGLESETSLSNVVERFQNDLEDEYEVYERYMRSAGGG
jgi:hypothetical protein